ncbi:unnamed protein product [Protopolystoma xenopodis]|uniref:Uncharacterized protein n=1 Tax=Protopolystoma xenopodis TaxID=117903 RepID=A0A448WEU9_9PLAT|nr:unnamed protein product [Protopolystoma xenopodis]
MYSFANPTLSHASRQAGSCKDEHIAADKEARHTGAVEERRRGRQADTRLKDGPGEAEAERTGRGSTSRVRVRARARVCVRIRIRIRPVVLAQVTGEPGSTQPFRHRTLNWTLSLHSSWRAADWVYRSSIHPALIGPERPPTHSPIAHSSQLIAHRSTLFTALPCRISVVLFVSLFVWLPSLMAFKRMYGQCCCQSTGLIMGKAPTRGQTCAFPFVRPFRVRLSAPISVCKQSVFPLLIHLRPAGLDLQVCGLACKGLFAYPTICMCIYARIVHIEAQKRTDCARACLPCLLSSAGLLSSSPACARFFAR